MITKEKLIERVDTLINLIEKKTDGDTMSLIYELVDTIVKLEIKYCNQ